MTKYAKTKENKIQTKYKIILTYVLIFYLLSKLTTKK